MCFDLKRGDTSVFFISLGNIPSLKDLLKISSIGYNRAGNNCFSSLFEMLSWLLLFLGISSLINVLISISLVGLKNILFSLGGIVLMSSSMSLSDFFIFLE